MRWQACIDQSSARTIASGTASFGRFLGCCDRMVAFVSTNYFSRLWCVYELASFCRLHKDELSSRLLMLSLDWPSAGRRSTTTREEREMLRGFRCADVRCAVPKDRAFVLAAIRREWGSIRAFEEFVQQQLPDVLAASKRSYSKQVPKVAAGALQLLVGG
jgi:hypothetical protein